MSERPHLLVTGGAGFIGSWFVQRALEEGCRVTVLDKLTYAGKREHLGEALKNPACELVVGDVTDGATVAACLAKGVTGVVHLAAESHVDNSILGPEPFIRTNLVGSYVMLETCRGYWEELPEPQKAAFRYVQVSSDEVYGALGETGYFTETSPYRPSSPYSASKAGADHLARAWWRTYGFPAMVTHCGNNYGPRQHREKLIPTVILRALAEKPIPIFGDGRQVRDWIHVEDHCHGLWLALTRGQPGGVYDFSGHGELENRRLAKEICAILDAWKPREAPYSDLITYVTDRPGHDWRYAMDDSATRAVLGFETRQDLRTALEGTVAWYLAEEGVTG